MASMYKGPMNIFKYTVNVYGKMWDRHYETASTCTIRNLHCTTHEGTSIHCYVC